MFWTKQREIQNRAKNLASFLLHINNITNNMKFDEFVTYCRNQEFSEVFYEKNKITGRNEYRFFDGKTELKDADFVFGVASDDLSENHKLRLSIIAVGYGRFFGIMILGGHPPISLSLSEMVRPSEYGRDTLRLYQYLLDFPGFRKFGQWFDQ